MRFYDGSRRQRLHLAADGAAILVLVILAALFLDPRRAEAQDAHYWTKQFGNRARLLGGAVIGSAQDISAVYYNPGAFALVENPELLLAGSVFQYTKITAEGGLMEERKLGSTSLATSPSLFAGEVRLGFLKGHRLAYSLLTRQSADFRLEGRGEIPGSDIFALPDLETLNADVRVEQDLDEYWFGITWAHSLGPRLGVGVTQFLAMRDHRAGFRSSVQALGLDGRAGVAIQRVVTSAIATGEACGSWV